MVRLRRAPSLPGPTTTMLQGAATILIRPVTKPPAGRAAKLGGAPSPDLLIKPGPIDAMLPLIVHFLECLVAAEQLKPLMFLNTFRWWAGSAGPRGNLNVT